MHRKLEHSRHPPPTPPEVRQEPRAGRALGSHWRLDTVYILSQGHMWFALMLSAERMLLGRTSLLLREVPKLLFHVLKALSGPLSHLSPRWAYR